jgi:hypothetical protein
MIYKLLKKRRMRKMATSRQKKARRGRYLAKFRKSIAKAMKKNNMRGEEE